MVTTPRIVIRLLPHDGGIEWSEITESSMTPPVQANDITSLAEQSAYLVHLLIGPERLIYRELTIPASSYKLTQQSIQWLAEETLPSDTDTLHWTILAQDELTVQVAGITPQSLNALLTPVYEAGLIVESVSIDGCYLPWREGEWTLLETANGWLTRTSQYHLYFFDEAWIIHLLNRFRPASITCFGRIPVGQAEESHSAIAPLSLYNPEECYVNLLHGDFRPKSPSGSAGRTLHLTAITSLICVVLVWLITKGGIFYRLGEMEELLTTQLQQQWRQYVPGNPHSHNIRFYLPRQLGNAFPALQPTLERLHDALQRHADITLLGVDYHQASSRLLVKVRAPNKQTVNAFITDSMTTLRLQNKDYDEDNKIWTLQNEKAASGVVAK